MSAIGTSRGFFAHAARRQYALAGMSAPPTAKLASAEKHMMRLLGSKRLTSDSVCGIPGNTAVLVPNGGTVGKSRQAQGGPPAGLSALLPAAAVPVVDEVNARHDVHHLAVGRCQHAGIARKQQPVGFVQVRQNV